MCLLREESVGGLAARTHIAETFGEIRTQAKFLGSCVMTAVVVMKRKRLKHILDQDDGAGLVQPQACEIWPAHLGCSHYIHRGALEQLLC